jgi:hypothetical protein
MAFVEAIADEQSDHLKQRNEDKLKHKGRDVMWNRKEDKWEEYRINDQDRYRKIGGEIK